MLLNKSSTQNYVSHIVDNLKTMHAGLEPSYSTNSINDFFIELII